MLLDEKIKVRSMEGENTTISKDGVVYKSNKLIEGRYILSAAAQKIVASVISRVDPRPSKSHVPLPTFRYSISELSKIAGVHKTGFYKNIRSYVRELKSIVVEVERADGKPGFVSLGLFRSFDFDDESEGVLTVEFESRIEEHIRDFAGNFTRYQLIQLSGLVSRYSIRLYELLRKSHNLGKSQGSVSFYQKSVDDLRAILGVKKTAYSGRFDSFRVNVIDRAQNELKDKTDLQFDYQLIKGGRKVVAIKFIIRTNVQFVPIDTPDEPRLLPADFDEGMLSMLKTIVPDVEDQDAVMIVTAYEKAFLTEALLTLSRMAAKPGFEFKKGRYSYLRGILKTMRQEDEAAIEKAKDRAAPAGFSDTSWAEQGEYDDWPEKD